MTRDVLLLLNETIIHWRFDITIIRIKAITNSIIFERSKAIDKMNTKSTHLECPLFKGFFL